ncbi:hypothetical protein RYX36_005329 [Vicia faba]
MLQQQSSTTFPTIARPFYHSFQYQDAAVSSPLVPVSLLGSSKGEEPNQKAITKAEKFQAVLKGIEQVSDASSLYVLD